MHKFVAEYLKGLNHEYNEKFVKICRHTVLMPIAEELMEIWGSHSEGNCDVTIAFGISTIDCVSVNFHLTENESLKSFAVLKVLEKMVDNDDFGNIKQEDYNELQWRSWNFTHTPSGYFGHRHSTVEFKLRFWYGDSKTCRLVDSGKTQPVMEVVCE